MNKLQQGDVLIKNTSFYDFEIPENELQELNHLTLAEGEATGHHHSIVEGIAKLYLCKNLMVLKVLSDYAKLRHQEHMEIDIPKGTYVIDRVSEFDYDSFEKRRVVD